MVELLVVIAIIGLLASIVLINLNSARNKAKSAAIKGALSELRGAAEMEYDIDGNYQDICTEAGGAAGNSVISTTAGTDFLRISNNINTNGGGNCGTGLVYACCNESANSTAYAVWSTLPSGGTWCVDSTGQSKSASPAADATVCP